MQDKKARFRCGQLCTTPAALDKVGRAGLIRLLERHLSGDWGDTCESDARANEEALRSGNGTSISARLHRELASNSHYDHHGSGSLCNDDPAAGRILR